MKRFLLAAAALAGILAGCSSGGGGTPIPTPFESFNQVSGVPSGTNGVNVSAVPNFQATQITAVVVDNNSPSNRTTFPLLNNGGTWFGAGSIVINPADTYTVTVTGTDASGGTVTGQGTFPGSTGGTTGGSTSGTTTVTTSGTTGIITPPAPPSGPPFG